MKDKYFSPLLYRWGQAIMLTDWPIAQQMCFQTQQGSFVDIKNCIDSHWDSWTLLRKHKKIKQQILNFSPYSS